jgi:hypothetical protein
VWRQRRLLGEFVEARRKHVEPTHPLPTLPPSPSRQRVSRPGAATRVSARSLELLARTSAPSPAVVRLREALTRKCSLLRFSLLKHFTPLPVLLLVSEQAMRDPTAQAS